jgi:hypothetical protein
MISLLGAWFSESASNGRKRNEDAKSKKKFRNDYAEKKLRLKKIN